MTKDFIYSGHIMTKDFIYSGHIWNALYKKEYTGTT